MSYVITDNYILEKETGHKIEVGANHRELRNVARKLNLGSGFQGFTPGFMCRSYQTNIINNYKETDLRIGITCSSSPNT